jgi:hypothetical protein
MTTSATSRAGPGVVEQGDHGTRRAKPDDFGGVDWSDAVQDYQVRLFGSWLPTNWPGDQTTVGQPGACMRIIDEECRRRP